MELKKKRVAEIHDKNGNKHTIVFDAMNRYAERTEYFLFNELIAVIPKDCIELFNEFVEPKNTTEVFSGTPNEHNMEKGDEDWYKQHMANQKQAVESGEKVAFWQNPDGSYSADTDLEPGTGLIGYSDSGESDFIVVYGKYPTPIKGQFWYDFQKRINTNFSWYITSRA